jgi:hypothetical protein
MCQPLHHEQKPQRRWLRSHLRCSSMGHEAEVFGVLHHKVDIPAEISPTANTHRVTFWRLAVCMTNVTNPELRNGDLVSPEKSCGRIATLLRSVSPLVVVHLLDPFVLSSGQNIST